MAGQDRDTLRCEGGAKGAAFLCSTGNVEATWWVMNLIKETLRSFKRKKEAALGMRVTHDDGRMMNFNHIKR